MAMNMGTRRLLTAAAAGLAGLCGLKGPDLRAQDREAPERGLQVTGSYRLGDIETVNTKNGNVLLRVPLASLPPGRGGNPGFQLTLNYNSKLWDTYVEHVEDPSTPDPLPDPNNPGSALPFLVKRTLRPALGNPGWIYNYQYKVDLDQRSFHRTGLTTACDPGNTKTEDQLLWYEYKVSMVFPDGSVRVFLPEGEATNTHNHDHYFPVKPDGIRLVTRCGGGVEGPAPGTSKVSYYSIDGTFLRLEFDAARDDDGDGTLDASTLWPLNAWTLYFPDGRRIKGRGYSGTQLFDSNSDEAKITIQRNLDGFDNPADVITDAVGRRIVVEKDRANGKHYIYQSGAGGAELKWTVDRGSTTASRDYATGVGDDKLCVAVPVVDQITLPRQLGALTFRFEYNGIANPASPCQTLADSKGLGEISKATAPWGARASYSYLQDIETGTSGRLAGTGYAVDNHITGKDFAYDVAGQANAVTESWSYGIGSVTAPDGGRTVETYSNEGRLEKVERRAGTRVVERVEKVWKVNTPPGLDSISARRANPYVKTEFTTLVGTSSKTAITDFTYDKNGNLLQADEYDWVASTSVPRAQGKPTGTIPAAAARKRRTVHTYHKATPAASDTTTQDPDAYYKATSPRLKSARASTEIRDGSGVRRSRRQFTYDDPGTKGNLTRERIGKSNASGVVPATLTSANSITLSHTYDTRSNRLTSTGGRGAVTRWTYGPIRGGSVSHPDLYPTREVVASGTGVARTTTYGYDFHTGQVTSARDADNNVTTRTTLDDIGRPTLVKEASGVSAVERHTATDYCDRKRRLVVRSDLSGNPGSGQLVTVTDYDQAGRVRLTRQYETAPPHSGCASYDSESAGIKVETRYQYVSAGTSPGLYTWTSNPYRGTATTGWTRTRLDRLGRVAQAGHFSGAARPSTSATPTLGTTTTAYDAEYTTVTDPGGKKRRSRLDGLGRLVRVDEPDSSGALGSTASPNQATAYTYDALSNLTGVAQGAQTRTFAYDSLSRLTRATNPESGAVNYTYDDNGNLTQRTDARSVATAYTYDALDRLTSRSYTYTGSDTAVSLGTTRVDYAYDSCGAYSEGRLCSVTARKGQTEVSRTAYKRYDALGRVGESTQTTGGAGYTLRYAYDRAGNLTSQTYPSGRVATYLYDGAGRISGARTGDDDWYAGGTGANAAAYAPHGGLRQLFLGNGLWEQRRYNARLQPTQIGLGTEKVAAGTALTTTRAGLLLLDYSYGSTSNNGNLLSQRIRVGTSLNRNQAYTYDSLNRLLTAAESGSGTPWSQTYAYDRYGNRRVTAGASHGSNQALTPQAAVDIATSTNRLAGTKGVNTVGYDPAGNLTADWAANTFAYDGDNRLVAFDAPMGTDSDTTYAYDGEGRRVRKVVGGTGGITTTYVYNVLGQLVAEFGGAASEQSGTQYLTPDHLGSTRVVTGAGGAILSRHDYLPFGEEIGTAYGGRSSVSGYTASLADGPSQKFTGKERDAESGLDYFGARYFSGAGGRFTGVDPENAGADPADPQSWNGYAYARNNPLLYVDPDGRYFVVCQSDGDCTTYAVDSDFYTFLEEENLQFDPETDEDGNLLPTNIYSVDEQGNRTLYGRATYSRHAPGLEPTGLVEAVVGGGGLTALARSLFRRLAARGVRKAVPRSSTATNLGNLGRAGSNKKVREVVGDSDDALKLFDNLRGNNPVREVEPGVFVAKGKTGGHVTFRPTSKSGPPTVDVHGIEPGVKKIKFVSE